MFDSPVKMALGLAIVAAMGGSYLSNRPEAVAVGGGAARPGFISSWFGGANTYQPPQARPAQPPSAALGFGRVELRPDGHGQYHTDVEIEGRRVPMLVDTGATLISLTFADAQRLGLSPAPADFKAEVSTANGMAKAALISLREVRVQNLLVRDVPALVLPQAVNGTSLLGMSFLQRLGGFEVASGTLVLRP